MSQLIRIPCDPAQNALYEEQCSPLLRGRNGDTYSIELSKDMYNVACEADGTPKPGELGVGGKASTTLTVKRYRPGVGETTLTAVSGTPGEDEFSFSMAVSSGDTGTKVGEDTARFDTIAGDTAAIVLTINIENILTGVLKVFTANKSLDGGTGYTVEFTKDSITLACENDGTVKAGQLGSGGTATTGVQVLKDGAAIAAVASAPGIGEFAISLASVTGGTASKVGDDGVQLDTASGSQVLVAVEIDLEGLVTITKYFIGTKSLDGGAGSLEEIDLPVVLFGDVDDGTYKLISKVLSAGFTLVEVNRILTSGTATIELQKNGVAITGLSALATDNTSQDATGSVNNVFAPGDVLTLVVSAGSSPVGLNLTLLIQP